MKITKNINSISLILICLGFILTGLLAGCGSSANVSGGSTQTGKVAILLTDGPTDEFSEVNVTVNEVSLLSDERGPVVLFSGARRINLLALQEVEDLFTITEDVPAGIYAKIRLRVSEPEFVRTDGGIITASQIHLVANGKIDLVPDHPIEVIPDETLIVHLDLDAEKSIFIHISNPNEPVFQFRPVVFVKVLHDFDTRLVSVRGEIVSIDPEAHSFLLRRTPPIFHLLKWVWGRIRMRMMRSQTEQKARMTWTMRTIPPGDTLSAWRSRKRPISLRPAGSRVILIPLRLDRLSMSGASFPLRMIFILKPVS